VARDDDPVLSPPWRGTLFDYNGVLVDDEHLHLAGFRHVVARFGIEISEAAYADRYLGLDDAGAFRTLLTYAGRAVDEALVRALIDEKAAWYMARAATDLRVFPHARAAILLAAAAGPVGVVSGALRREIQLGLGVIGVEERVAFIVAAEDTARCKPDPEGYDLGARELARVGVPAGAVWAIEDSVAGVQAARAAGLRACAVQGSYPREALRAAGADRILPDLGALLAGAAP
jgi:HAD superfamily hydrolase (TIGR01509 family)